eukprot:jgi/Chrzof1/3800/Cz13g09090.t1
MPFDTNLFKGLMHVSIRGLNSTQATSPVSTSNIPSSGSRALHVVIQGKFKIPVKLNQFWMGQEFSRPPALPQSFADLLFQTAAKVFSSTTKVSTSSSSPSFMNPVLAACQLVNVAAEGEQPDMWAATEDMRLFSTELADKNGAPLSSDKRRKYFDKPANAAAKLIGTEYVWTVHMWQNIVDVATYRLGLPGFISLDLTQFLDGQPIQIMAKDLESGDYFFNLLLWHEKLVHGGAAKCECEHSQKHAKQSAASRLIGLFK